MTSLPDAAEVVISYAEEDRPLARAVVDAIRAGGLTVFWDQDLQPGQWYRRVIEGQLTTMLCHIVIWTATSRESDWVCDEADVGRLRGVLVPIVVRDTIPPLGFRATQQMVLPDGVLTAEHQRVLVARVHQIMDNRYEGGSLCFEDAAGVHQIPSDQIHRLLYVDNEGVERYHRLSPLARNQIIAC